MAWLGGQIDGPVLGEPVEDLLRDASVRVARGLGRIDELGLGGVVEDQGPRVLARPGDAEGRSVRDAACQEKHPVP